MEGGKKINERERDREEREWRERERRDLGILNFNINFGKSLE